MSQFLDAALAYRRAGMHPIPVEPRGKRPILSTWRQYVEHQPTEDEILQWWTETPDANVALLMGRGTFAVDIDGPEGEAALAGAGVVLPHDAPSVTTGKGRHVFLTGRAPNSVGVLSKVDTRSDGGYVVAPPSIHSSGTVYTWTNPADHWPPPVAPVALLELLARPHSATPGLLTAENWVSVALSGVTEGGRDVTCTRLAGYLWGKGLVQDAVESILQLWAERCDPPFPHDQVVKCVASIAKRAGGPDAPAGPPASISDALDETLAEMNLPSSERRIRPSELPGLDHRLGGGFAPGELILLGARPGVGKTALACQIGRRAAKAGAGVLYISREMTRTSLTRRLLVQESMVRASVLKTGNLSDIERDMVTAAVTRLRDTPLWITQDVASVADISEALARYESHLLGLVIVDYLQLVSGPDDLRTNKRAEVEYVSKALKALAIRHGVPILVLSSLRRLQKRKDGSTEPPDMSDLRESGELEHDGDIVMILTREFDSQDAALVVAKNRDGRVGRIKLTFTGEMMRFEEVHAT